MRAWNRKKKPKHTTKMKWVWMIDEILDDDSWIYENVVKYYSISRCTKKLSIHQKWSLSYNEIKKRNRYTVFNCNDMKMWRGY